MNPKTFVSPSGWFKLTLPAHWDEYELEDEEGTYGFLNTQPDYWAGNLRITPLKLSGKSEDEIKEFVNSQMFEQKDSSKVRIADFDCVFYKQISQSEDESLLLYYWIMGKKDIVFISSFTIDKNDEFTKETRLNCKPFKKSLEA